MSMNPYLMEELIRQREQELRRSVRRCTPAPRIRRRRRSCLRRRTGWVLIEIGLTLAQGSGDA
jgi:hypothetical protein